MKIVINKPRFGFLNIALASYLVNVFYLKNIMGISRLFTWGITLLYIGMNINRVIVLLTNKKRFNTKYLFNFVIWVLLIIITPIAHGTNDYTYFNTLTTILGTALNLFVVVLIADKHKNEIGLLHSFMYLYMYTMVAYVFFTTICLVVPTVKQIVLNNVYISSGNMALIGLRKYATRIGWAGFSGYSVSIKCTIANVFALYFIVRNNSDTKKQAVFYYLIYIITLLGEFYYSRTGLIASMLILAVTFILTLRAKNILNSIWAILLVGVVIALIPTLQAIALTNRSVAWILEPFLNFLSDDGFTSTSSAHLINDMLFRLNSNQLLWGDGMYTGATGYYMKTDLGFMRLILYFGVPGLLVTYFMIVRSLVEIRKNFEAKIGNWFSIALLCSFLVFEFKGESIIFLLPLFYVLGLIVRMKIDTDF